MVGKVEEWYLRADPADALIAVDHGPSGELGIREVVHPTRDGTFLLDGADLMGAEISPSLPADGVYMAAREAVTVTGPLPMRFELPRPEESVVAGRVLDTAGRPLAGAAVMLDPAVTGHYRYQETDASGRFVIGELEPVHYYLDAYSMWTDPAEIELDLAAGQKVRDLSIGLAPAQARTIRGRVVGPDGTSLVTGATVEFGLAISPALYGRPGRGNGRSPTFRYAAKSDAEGRFAIKLPDTSAWVGVQHWTLAVTRDGYLDQRYIGFSPETAPDECVFQLYQGGLVTGDVRLAGGSPAPAGSRVVVYHSLPTMPGVTGGGSAAYYAQVDPRTGRFQLRIPPGEHWVQGQIPDHADPVAPAVVMEGGSVQVRLRSSPGVTIEGRLTAADTGEPIAGASVSAACRDPRTDTPDYANTPTDANGYFRAGEIGYGAINVSVYAEGWVSLDQHIHGSGPGVQRLDLRLARAASQGQ